MGWESRLTVHHGGSWVPSQQILIPRSLLADRQGYAWTDWQCHVAWTWLHVPSHSLPCPCYLAFPTHNPQKYVLRTVTFLSCHPWKPVSSSRCPPPVFETRLPIHIDGHSTSSQISAKTYTSRSQHIYCGRQLRCFWWGIQVLQWPKFFLKA